MRYYNEKVLFAKAKKMTAVYEHTQKGHKAIVFGLLLIIFAGSAACFILLDIVPMRTASEVVYYWIVAAAWLLNGAFLIWLMLITSALTVVIEDGFIRIRFGGGAWRKKFGLEQIMRAEAVRNKWSFGWGIHYTGSAWLYNVSGLDAVEITMQNGGKRRIGTDEPEKLTEAINSCLAGE